MNKMYKKLSVLFAIVSMAFVLSSCTHTETFLSGYAHVEFTNLTSQRTVITEASPDNMHIQIQNIEITAAYDLGAGVTKYDIQEKEWYDPTKILAAKSGDVIRVKYTPRKHFRKEHTPKMTVNFFNIETISSENTYIVEYTIPDMEKGIYGINVKGTCHEDECSLNEWNNVLVEIN